MSVRRERMRSIGPLQKPDISPRAVPTTRETPAPARPTSSDTRAPWMRRLSTARPTWSVPSKRRGPSPPGQLGGSRRSPMLPSAGSYGAMKLAPMAAVKITRRTSAAPSASLLRQSRRPLPMLDARVEPHIERVRGKGDGGHRGREEEGRALDDRVVAHEDGLDHQAPDAGPVEDGLRDHRTAQQGGDAQPEDGDDGDGGVFQDVAENHGGLREALRTRGAHEVLVQHLQDAGAREPRHSGRGIGSQGERRHHQVGDGPASRGRQDSEVEGQNQDQDDAEPERGDTLADERGDQGEMIERAVPADSRENADG